MSKIDRSSAGGSSPIGNQQAAESIQQSTPSTEQAKANPATTESPSSAPKPVVDKNVTGDLISTGSRIQAELQKQLDSKKLLGEGLSPEQMAKKASENIPRFAPPYVPVGPVVMGDNIGTPGGPIASGQVNEMNLKADQFQFNDQGNLVITNPKLIEFFKSLKEAGGDDIRLAFMKMKPPGEE